MPPRHLAFAAAVAALAALTACGHTTTPHAPPSATTSRPAAVQQSIIAIARSTNIPIYQTAGTTTPAARLHSPNADGAPRVFLVTDQRTGWLHVLLPTPPNGSTGWVRTTDVRLTRTSYRITVGLAAHRLRVYSGARLIVDTAAAIGTADTPTPGGRYYLTELLKTPNPKGPYGPYAYGLSGQSTALTQFDGHAPVIGIHGTNEPNLLGTSVSHGCIRVSNQVITRLAGMLPLGTPVQIAT